MAAIAWTDENTSIVTELFAEEVGHGNRSSTHLNNLGYEEVANRFKDKTDIQLKKTQPKNKWDKLKIDYNIWKRLLKQTGAGYSNKWWKKAKIDIPGCGRFQKQGIRNEEHLKVMFEDINND